ncbi:MAG TPA: ATP-binding protein [Bryobacteraceae bacterium]|nr:ATP-binding protein [Bryobacteraceae bacterium]
MPIDGSLRATPSSAWSNLSLRSKVLLVAALPVMALLASVLLLNKMEQNREKAEQRVLQALDFRSQLQNVYILLIDAESAVRNYGLTGRDDGLEQFSMVGPSLDAAFDKVRDLVADEPEQVKRLSDLRTMAHARLAGLAKLHDYYESHRSDHIPAPAELMATAKVSPDVFLAVNALGAAEAKRFQDRTKAEESRRTQLQIAIAICVVLGLISGFVALLLFSNGVVRRLRQLELGASQLAQGLAPGILLNGADELGRLSAAMERAGATLASRDRELQLALDNANLLIWDLNPDTQEIHYHAGPRANDHPVLPVELLAPSVEGWISGVHPDDRANVRSELHRALAENGALKIEYRVVIRGGETRWMMVRAQSHQAPGRLLGILGDITERRRAALEIERQSQELAKSKLALERQTGILQSILDSMGDGVVVADTAGRFLVFNPAAQQLIRSRSFAGIADHWAERHGLFQADGVTLYRDEDLPFARAIRGESVDAAELFVKPPGTTEGTWASVTARALRQENGEIGGGVMVLRDITAAKRDAEALELAKQQAEAANQAKSEFLSRMSHELRTPLNSILGFAQLLELATLDERDRDNVAHILKGGYHLLDLINEILDLSRIEAGRLSLSPEPIAIREVLVDALDLVRPLAAERRINMTPESAISLGQHVRADRQRLKQVLLNLLSNAIKYNRERGSVLVSGREIAPDRLRVEVVDSGVGISEEGLKKIFRPFERLTADQTEVGGTGLGLALSKRLIEAMGGTIGVESSAGLGSRFYIELELAEDPSKWLDDHLETMETPVAADRHSGTVLYVEDNVSNLRLIERIMEHCPDVRLITAMLGQLGLDLAEMHAPDWILLDLHLPDLPGEEVLRRLRHNPRTRHIPVTILSADATRGQIARLLSEGARDYLTKPVDVRQLMRLLQQTLPHAHPDLTLETANAQRDHSE